MVRYYDENSSYSPTGKRRLSAWVRKCVEAEGYACGDINYIFCDPQYHIGINRNFLGHDYHTDVITFDYSDLEQQRVVSGDIFIDPQTVKENAEIYGVEPDREMLRVMIHGVMHLCGYGDKSLEEQERMRHKEDRCLELLGAI